MKTKIHLTFDCWTSQDYVRTFMATIAHFVNHEFKYCEWLIDFISIEGRHTGKTFVEYVFKALEDWKLTGKVMTVVGDNASNNDTLAVHLGSLLNRKMPRGRCMSHIINLGAQALLGNGVRYVHMGNGKGVSSAHAVELEAIINEDAEFENLDDDSESMEEYDSVPYPDDNVNIITDPRFQLI